MEEDDQVRAAGDGLRLVEGSVADRQAVARRHIAIGIVRKGGVDRAAGNRGHRMREELARRRIAVIADIGFC